MRDVLLISLVGLLIAVAVLWLRMRGRHRRWREPRNLNAAFEADSNRPEGLGAINSHGEGRRAEEVPAPGPEVAVANNDVAEIARGPESFASSGWDVSSNVSPAVNNEDPDSPPLDKVNAERQAEIANSRTQEAAQGGEALEGGPAVPVDGFSEPVEPLTEPQGGPETDELAGQDVLELANRGSEPAEAVQDPAGAGSDVEPASQVTESASSSDFGRGGNREEEVGPLTKVPSRDVPRRYAGLLRTPPQRAAGSEPLATGESRLAQRSPPIEVRVRFARDGWCSVSLIARRSSGMPEQLTVRGPDGSIDLVEMGDDWYQDVVPDDVAQVLRDGAVFTDDAGGAVGRWSLSGRPLYVLGADTTLSGWVSRPSLQLYREHVVLCDEPIRDAVEQALRAAGSDPSASIDASLGAPQGWVVFRSIIPTTAVQPAAGSDILNALRPLPEIDISLEGGIRLEYATWLACFPPAIRVYGDPEHASEVLLDGDAATLGEDGAYRAPGWDTPGTHTVWCAGTTKSYSLVPFSGSWGVWEAHSFRVGRDRRISICGPLVWVGPAETSRALTVQVPASNPIVLGAVPGEYRIAVRASDVHHAPYLASVNFRAVWALPYNPLQCDKRQTRVMPVGPTAQPHLPDGWRRQQARTPAVQTWCRIVLDAGRKGLLTEPDIPSVRAAWLAYRGLARQIWRMAKA